MNQCPVCHKLHSKEQVFCSRTCSNKSRTNKVEVVCLVCQKKVLKHPAWLRSKAQFCSMGCRNQHQKRRVTKICKVCGGSFEVRKCESRKYSTCERKRCRSKKGAQNANWRGGTAVGRDRSSNRYRAWRKAVFERDNYTCQCCGKRGGDLEADHIKPWAFYPKLRYVVSNGRTLCVTCHRKTFKSVFSHRPKKAA